MQHPRSCSISYYSPDAFLTSVAKGSISIHKSGDNSDRSNYGGMSAVVKLFYSILNKRTPDFHDGVTLYFHSRIQILYFWLPYIYFDSFSDYAESDYWY